MAQIEELFTERKGILQALNVWPSQIQLECNKQSYSQSVILYYTVQIKKGMR